MTQRRGRATTQEGTPPEPHAAGQAGLTPEDFLRAVQRHPALELAYVDPTRCIVRYNGPAGPRDIRLGFWAIKQFGWKRFLEAFHIPPGPD